MDPAQVEGGMQPIVRSSRWHPDVSDDDVGPRSGVSASGFLSLFGSALLVAWMGGIGVIAMSARRRRATLVVTCAAVTLFPMPVSRTPLGVRLREAD